jgi:hypothetical protein
MDLFVDGLLIAATLFAGAYCWVLSRRVQALKSLDSGLGGAIVTLTRQIELARATLEEARAGSRETRQDLAQLVARAEAAGAQLRLLIAATPAPQSAPQPAPLPAAPVAASAPVMPAVQPAPAQPEPAPAPRAVAERVAVDAPPPEAIAALRREGFGPRLVPAPEPEPEAEPVRDAAPQPAAAELLPQPRRMPPIESLLRRPGPPARASDRPTPEEEALIAALSAIAAGGER